jgi:hypothetical protein
MPDRNDLFQIDKSSPLPQVWLYIRQSTTFGKTGDDHEIGATYLAEQLFYRYMLPGRVGHVVAG